MTTVVRLLGASLAAVAAGAVLLWFGAWRTQAGAGLPPVSPLQGSVPLLLIWLVALGLGLLVALLRAPSELQIARRADRHLGLEQRLSTSWELLTRGSQGPSAGAQAANVMARSLLLEVEGLAPSLSFGTLWRSTAVDRFTFFGSLLSLALLVVALTVPVPTRAAPVSAGVAEATVADQVATLDRVAELLDRSAELEESDYLRAVAASLAELRDDLADGKVSAEQRDERIEELARHLMAAANQIGGGFGAAVAGALEAAADSGLRPAEGQLGQAEDGPGGPVAGRPALDLPPELAHGAASFFGALDSLSESLERAHAAAPNGRAASDPAVLEGFYGGVLNAQTDPEAAAPDVTETIRTDGPAAGQAVGAAERSTDGAGDAAGAGSGPLQPGSQAFLEQDVGAIVATALPQAQVNDGGTVPVELVPGTRLSSAGAAAAGSPRTFSRSEEAAFSERGIASTYAAAVSRYFTPDKDRNADE